jgi:XRE family transcriptional regulator, fatty acid utilization regulator
VLLNQDTLKFVFGMKLRGLRLDKGLSLKELSRKTGLSPSYINEIEKGKKYPKSEKILVLAQALDEKYEDLVSLELKRDLQIVQNLLDKKFLTGIPFDLFGIPAATVFELLSERPKKMRALVGTILEIARAHNIQTDDFLYALLRSYISMHENYFPSLEEAAREVTRTMKIDWRTSELELKEKLIATLKNFKVSVVEKNLEEVSPEFKELFYFISRGKKLFVSKKLDLKEQIFVLARELGYQHLKLKERTQSSLIMNLDSFAQLFNHFSASYFASALLIPEDEIKSDLKNLFSQPDWNEQSFQALVDKYPCAYESFFHRITQILPKHFALNRLFFLRYEYNFTTKKYEIARELHLSDHHDPHKVIGNEHYCSRWLIHRLTQKQIAEPGKQTLGIQRSAYAGTDNEYLIMGMSSKRPLMSRSITTVCIGVVVNEKLKTQISWCDSKTIPAMIVGETCERCAYKECPDRQAQLDPNLDPEKYERIFKALEEVTDLD